VLNSWIENKKIGISRWKSGSHTMAYYLNYLHNSSGEVLTEDNFRVLGAFDNLIKGVQEKDADIFLWEVSTTKPWFDSGALKYVRNFRFEDHQLISCQIGEVSTPWPAFSIVSSNSFATNETSSHIFKHRLVPALQEGVDLFLSSPTPPLSFPQTSPVTFPSSSPWNTHLYGDNEGERMTPAERINREFGHKLEDAVAWLNRTRYASRMAVNAESFQRAVTILSHVGLVPPAHSLSSLWGGESNKAITFEVPQIVPENEPITISCTAK
jgi:hypothetical protein